MGLAWTGTDEIETVVTALEATTAFAVDDEEVIVATLFAALIEALYQGQVSGNARVRWAELLVDANGDRCAPITSAIIMDLATKAHMVRSELASVTNGPTAAQALEAAEGDGYTAANFGPAH